MDGTTRPQLPGGARLHLGTHLTRARLACSCEGVFLVEIHVAIDLERDPAALEEITDDGLQRFTCPDCGRHCDLAEPILIHDRERERMALFVPFVLGHRALAFQAELAVEIAGADPSVLPPRAVHPALLVGVPSLREWLFGPGARSVAPPGRKPAPAPSAKDREAGPSIHEAFADLARPDSQLPSTIPSSPEIEDVDEDEPMFAEDWLARDTLSPAGPDTDPPPRIAEPATGAPRGARSEGPEPAVDFAELLEEEEEDEDDGLGEGAVVEESDRDRRFDPEFLVVDDDEEEEEEEIPEDLFEEGKGEGGIPATAPTPEFSCPLLEGADRAAELREDGVILSYRLPASRVALFDPSAADLWFQLLDAGGVPLMAITLVSDPTMDRPHWIAWPLDPRRGSDREIVHELRRSYRAEIRLFDEQGREAARFSLSADRELNVSVVLERVSRVLAAGPADDDGTAAALARLSAAAQPFGDPLPRLFTSYGLPAMESFEQAAAALSELTRWLEPERYDHLVLVRSLPLDYLEEIVVEVLDRSVRRGVRLPERLQDRAIALGHAADRAALCRVLVENFDRLMTSGQGPASDLAARNWRDLLTDCAEWDLAWDPQVQDRAEELLEAHGFIDEVTMREAQAALAAPDGLETDQLLRMLQHRRLRRGAVAALCQRAEPAAWKDAVRALEHLDPAGLLEGVRAVAGLREAAVGEITALLGSKRPHVRQGAGALLGGLALRRTLMPVLKALGSEPTPVWTEFSRAVAATGSAAVRSIERQLTDEQFPLERLALAVRMLERDAPKACARFEAMAESGDERAARLMELARDGDIEPSRVSPAERYGELLRRSAAGEIVSARETAAAVEAYRAIPER